MQKALVIGVNGQDGRFLAKHLLARNYRVMGVGRQPGFVGEEVSDNFTYFQADLRADRALAEPLNSFKPDLVFHVAAVHTSAGGEYEVCFHDLLKVNTGSVHAILEFLRAYPGSRLIYASSAKVFGDSLPGTIDEKTPLINSCLYSISKNASYHLIEYYRRHHAAKASVVFLFNHESEWRPGHFFIPRMLDCLASAVRDSFHVSQINTLDFYCDWGSAEEYMSIVIDMLERAPGEDFVLASGTCTFARKLVEELFSNYGLNYRQHLAERIVDGSSKPKKYQINLDKLDQRVCRIPRVGIYEVCKTILRNNYGI